MLEPFSVLNSIGQITNPQQTETLAAIGQMLAVLPVWVLSCLLAGGVIYTLGAVVYITKIFNFVPGVFGFHEIWHIFVMLAAAAHFVAVLGVALS